MSTTVLVDHMGAKARAPYLFCNFCCATYGAQSPSQTLCHPQLLTVGSASLLLNRPQIFTKDANFGVQLSLSGAIGWLKGTQDGPWRGGGRGVNTNRARSIHPPRPKAPPEAQKRPQSVRIDHVRGRRPQSRMHAHQVHVHNHWLSAWARTGRVRMTTHMKRVRLHAMVHTHTHTHTRTYIHIYQDWASLTTDLRKTEVVIKGCIKASSRR